MHSNEDDDEEVIDNYSGDFTDQFVSEIESRMNRVGHNFSNNNNGDNNALASKSSNSSAMMRNQWFDANNDSFNVSSGQNRAGAILEDRTL